jgi:urease accessory protein
MTDETQNSENNVTGAGSGFQPASLSAFPSFSWVVGLLQAGDSFYPTGSYAHSFGLEGLVQASVVRDRDTLREFIFRSVLPSLRQAELPVAAHAWRALAGPDWAAVEELCRLSAALKAPRELREASAGIGRQRAELAARLHSHPLAQEFLDRASAEGWPFSSAVSSALEGRVLNAPLPAVLAGICYATVVAIISAAMKILRLGQNAAQSLLAEVLQASPGIMAAAEQVPLDETGWFNPWLDIASARHESADARMFIS